MDRQLLLVSVGLIAFGLLTLYSAGQTDVPTRAAGVWHRQFVWVGIGVVAAAVVFHVSPRLLEWLAPVMYGFSLFLLVLVLLIGTGAGTARAATAGFAWKPPDRAAVGAGQGGHGAHAGQVSSAAGSRPARCAT